MFRFGQTKEYQDVAEEVESRDLEMDLLAKTFKERAFSFSPVLKAWRLLPTATAKLPKIHVTPSNTLRRVSSAYLSYLSSYPEPVTLSAEFFSPKFSLKCVSPQMFFAPNLNAKTRPLLFQSLQSLLHLQLSHLQYYVKSNTLLRHKHTFFLNTLSSR